MIETWHREHYGPFSTLTPQWGSPSFELKMCRSVTNLIATTARSETKRLGYPLKHEKQHSLYTVSDRPPCFIWVAGVHQTLPLSLDTRQVAIVVSRVYSCLAFYCLWPYRKMKECGENLSNLKPCSGDKVAGPTCMTFVLCVAGPHTHSWGTGQRHFHHNQQCTFGQQSPARSTRFQSHTPVSVWWSAHSQYGDMDCGRQYHYHGGC